MDAQQNNKPHMPWLLHSLAAALRNTRHVHEGRDSARSIVEQWSLKIDALAAQREHFDLSDQDVHEMREAVEAVYHWVISLEESLFDPLEGPPH